MRCRPFRAYRWHASPWNRQTPWTSAPLLALPCPGHLKSPVARAASWPAYDSRAAGAAEVLRLLAYLHTQAENDQGMTTLADRAGALLSQ